MRVKTEQTSSMAKMTPMTWSMVCLPDAKGQLDPHWLDQIRKLHPASIYSTARLAHLHGLQPLAPEILTDEHWLLTLNRWMAEPILVLRSGVELPTYFLERMAALAKFSTSARVLLLLGNHDDRLNPFNGLKDPGTPQGADALLWNTSACQLSFIEPVIGTSATAAWVLPQAVARDAFELDQAYAVADLCFVHDPNRPLIGQSKLSPLVNSALGCLRERIAALLETGYVGLGYPGLEGKPVTLHISHDWGGGIARWIDDLHRHDHHAHHLVLASRAPADAKQYGHELVLYADGPGHAPIQRFMLDPVIADTCISHSDYQRFVHWLLDHYGIGRIVVSSLIGHSLDALNFDIPTTQVLHDFYPASPVLDSDPLDHIEADGSLDLQALIDQHASTFKFIHRSAQHWQSLRIAWANTVRSRAVQLIAPSAHVANRWHQLFASDALPDIVHIPHGFNAPETWASAESLNIRSFTGEETLHLVSIGRLSRGKGLNRLIKVAEALGSRVRFTILGGGYDAMALFGRPNVDVILDYSVAELPDLLRQANPHAAVFLSRVPETWNYVLSEVRALGLPVIAPDLGSFPERVEHGKDGLLYPSSSDGLIELLESILAGRLIWPMVFTRPDEPNMADAIHAYDALVPAREVRFGLAPKPTLPAKMLGEAIDRGRQIQHQLVAVEHETQTLHQRITEQAQWLDRLDRTIKERTEWALNIDRALRDREHELQQTRNTNQTLQHELSLFEEEGRYLEALKNQVAAIEAEREEARRAHADVYQQLTQLQEQHRRLDEQMSTILRSHSWRLTRPLRVTVRIISALRQRKAWHPMNWSRQFKRLMHALRVHGWRVTLEALQHHRPIDLPARTDIKPVEAPSQDNIGPPVRWPSNRERTPKVSIIIPVYNNLAYTARCLNSLVEQDDGSALVEIIVVDDGSGDGTADYLTECEGIQVITNEHNLGFIGSCNAGAAAAQGTFLVFLNNDTQVTENWLGALLKPFEQKSTGIVGARLVYPSGELQEAGGIIFNDGSGWNYGRLGSASASRVQFLSEADYVSGACLAIRASIFRQLGGFDVHYSPAYYEDTDLCFKVRDMGLKVMYQPRSTVIHFEGISSGTSESSGTKRYQAINREKFKSRWAETLAHHPDPVPGPQATVLIEKARHHRAKGHILVIDAVTPQPDQDSGSVRMLAILELLVELGYRVSFMPINLAWDGRYSEALQDRGIEVIHHPETSSPRAWLETYGALVDWVIGSRYYVLEDLLAEIHKYCPSAKVVFDTVDLHFLREQRKAELEQDTAMADAAKTTRKKELNLIENSQTTLVVSTVEKTLLDEIAPTADIRILSNIHNVQSDVAPFSSRQGLLFVGGFQHPPNLDAARWLVEEILPALLAVEPNIELHLIGSRMPDWLRSTRTRGLRNHGFVEDITPFLQQSKLALAPLRYGAGVKGKVNQAMAYGLPVVATQCAAEGMHVEHDRDILIADDTDAFVEQILRVYHDADLWGRLSKNGQANVEKHFSRHAAKEVLQAILAPSLDSQHALNTP